MQHFYFASGKLLSFTILTTCMTKFFFFASPFLLNKSIQFLGLRYGNHMNIGFSLIWLIKQTEILDLNDMDRIKFVGWELNKNQKPQPRMVSMRDSMDPQV